jgi:hypothetical protein
VTKYFIDFIERGTVRVKIPILYDIVTEIENNRPVCALLMFNSLMEANHDSIFILI